MLRSWKFLFSNLCTLLCRVFESCRLGNIYIISNFRPILLYIALNVMVLISSNHLLRACFLIKIRVVNIVFNVPSLLPLCFNILVL